MKKQSTIKLKKLSELGINDLIEIAIIEKVCFPLDTWEFPHYIYFSNMMFIDNFILEFRQKKKNEDYHSETVVFSYNFNNFYFDWYLQNTPESKEIKNISMQTIKYLIEKNYDLPIFKAI